jgi:putative transposase
MRKRHTAEEIGRILAEVGRRTAADATVEQVCRELGIGPATYYLWQRKYGRMDSDQLGQLRELQRENARLRRLVTVLSRRQVVLQEVVEEFLTPVQRRQAVEHIQKALSVSQRHACAVLRQSRSTQRRRAGRRVKDDLLMEAIRRTAQAHPQAGYRRIAELLRTEGESVSDKQVYRLWRLLKSPRQDGGMQ